MTSSPLQSLHPAHLRRLIRAGVPVKAVRDVINRLRYGADAPQSDAAIFVVPGQITQAFDADQYGRKLRRRMSGTVKGGDWDQCRKNVGENLKFISCRMRFVDGADWADTPVYQKMLAEIAQGEAPDECRSPQDVADRYAALDQVFKTVKSAGRMLQRSETPEAFRREHGGVLIHVARDGTCLRSGGGAHRFAIAKILDLPEMPAQVGVVHTMALTNGHFAPLTRSRYAD